MLMRFLTVSVYLLLAMQGTVLAQETETAFAYHFPRFTGEAGSQITIVNPGQAIAEAQIQFFTEEGLPTVRFVTLLPTNQLRLSGSELGVGSTGALTVSSATALQVTVALGGGAEQAVGPGEAGADIVVPFAHGTRGKTSLDVFNPGRNEARVFVIAVSPEGTALGASDFFLPPHGSFHGDISELVGQAVLPPNDVSHLLVRAPTNVFQVRREVVASALIQEYSNFGADVTTRTDAALSSGNSEATRNSAIRLPLFVDGAGFFSLLQVINTSPSLQSITLRALSEASKLVSGSQNPASITLGAGASIRENVGKIFGFEDGTVAMGSIVVEGSQYTTLDAVVALGNTLGTNLVVVGGRPVLGDNDFVFNTRAIDREVYDGITLVNPHSFNADVLFLS